MTFEEKQKILTENMREFSKRQNLAKQQKKLTASELARVYCEFCSDIGNIFKDLERFSAELSASDEITFLSEICRSPLEAKIKSMLFIGSSEPTSAGSHSKISYFKNRYNDTAFEHFSHSVPNAKPDYTSSFAECCENVLDGRCEYCILPIMNSSDGRLMSFYSLLDRYELKICETVDIDGEGSAAMLRHALLGRSCKEQRKRIAKDEKYIFEFSVIDESTDFFAPLFEAAIQVGAKLRNIDSLPVEYAPHMQKFFLSFAVPTSNAITFRLFVALKHKSYTPIGIYKDTE